MNADGEKIAVLETKVEVMEDAITELKAEVKEMRKQLYMIFGGLAVLQTLATLFLKFGGTH